MASANSSDETPSACPYVDQLQPHWFTSPPPEIAEMNKNVIQAAELTPTIMDRGPLGYRKLVAGWYSFGDPDRILDLSIDGDPPVKVSLYFPSSKATAKPRGALLHLHGGGWTVGSAKGQNDPRLLRHAENCNMTVVSVEYRLSPEHTHPAAVLDCVAAATWLASSAGRAAAQIAEDAPLLLVGESGTGKSPVRR